MRILKMRLENFQGITELEFNPRWRNVEIHGQNGAGKTTIFNAYTFGLFGTMWDGSTAKIHRRDEQGNEIYDGTVHAVEIEFYSRLENKNFKIRREIKDKFNKNGILPATQPNVLSTEYRRKQRNLKILSSKLQAGRVQYFQALSIFSK